MVPGAQADDVRDELAVEQDVAHRATRPATPYRVVWISRTAATAGHSADTAPGEGGEALLVGYLQQRVAEVYGVGHNSPRTR